MRFSDWATIGIYKSRDKLYELYDEKQYNQTPTFLEYVKSYSKTFKNVCRQAKSLYIKDRIVKSENKIQTTWKIVNNESGKTKSRDGNFELIINNNMVTTDTEVASTFENFFQNVPILLTDSLNSSPTAAQNLLRGNINECKVLFHFKHIDASDISKNFKLLKLKKTGDIWGMSVKVISQIIDVIAPLLAIIFNECVDLGTFPNLMKHSKLIPLFKSGNKNDINNYRPISILPALSKIFEKIILNQLLYHFNVNNLLHPEQYGFTKGRSTTDAGAKLIKHVYDAWECSQNAMGVFCDLSKAFDCVDHKTLLLKLSHYGIQNVALNLVASYLSNRTQRVCINDAKSQGSNTSMGVPQGSILGPFLFLVYINDLPYHVSGTCDIVLFADDTSLIFKTDRSKDNSDEVNRVMSHVSHWFTVNNLLLNAKKTKCVEFILPNVKKIDKNIMINGESLKIETSTVFLGVTLDNKLQWGAHIDSLAGKLSSAAYAVRKIRQITDVEIARLVYFAYFHSVMSYGILLWGKAADIETIFILQKRAVRSIYKLKSRESLREKFKEIGILTVASQYIYNNIVFVRQHISLYKQKVDINSRLTRNGHKLVSSAYRLRKVQGSFVGLSIRFYNMIPKVILDLPMHKFKEFVKTHLLERGYYTIDEFFNDKVAWKHPAPLSALTR
ncbi:jg23354 [Pararge aegeria aegeria]|uniref:Jg23354 protein n=1 Tax=Pararge aegeria aegeria TaxID=348720 RepID=A0A8S4QIZ0_9NEOP|nr:jg23354 [Pararge aegeria aegeria]